MPGMPNWPPLVVVIYRPFGARVFDWLAASTLLNPQHLIWRIQGMFKLLDELCHMQTVGQGVMYVNR